MKTTVVLLLLICSTASFAQKAPRSAAAARAPREGEKVREADSRHSAMHLLARVDRDSVVLRWAPSKPAAWYYGNRFGYIVERVEFGADGRPVPGGTVAMTREPLRPWALEEWGKRWKADTTDAYVAVSAQLVHGKFATPVKNPDDQIEIMRNAKKDTENRAGFALFCADNSTSAADGLALRFVDRGVTPGTKYVYRVYQAKQDPTYRIDTATVSVTIESFAGFPAPDDLTATGRDGHISLRWSEDTENRYSGYNVYRSEDGGRTYRKLTTVPLVFVTPKGEAEPVTPAYEDKDHVVNYRKYRYQVRGVSSFAELSAAAEVESFARDLTAPAAPVLGKPKQTGKTTVALTWDLPSVAGDLKGFVITRGSVGRPTTGYRALTPDALPPTARSFTDPEATQDEGYYVVAAFDTAGNYAESTPLFVSVIDSIAPATPRGFSGTMDSTGIVTLRWNRNTEADIDGYRVLWANDPTHEFGQLTPTVYRDTVLTYQVSMKSLTPSVYYKVVAVDKRYLHSDASAMLEVRRPDVIPPTACIFTNLFVTDSSVLLRWGRSASEDIARVRLVRRENGTDAWKDLATLTARDSMYLDRAVKKTVEYEYNLFVVDGAGHETPAPRTVTARPYDSGHRAGVDAIDATVKDGTVTLSWRAPQSLASEKHWFMIYRGSQGQAPSLYKVVEEGHSSFTDAGCRKGQTYEYAILVRTKTGESTMSTARSITIPGEQH